MRTLQRAVLTVAACAVLFAALAVLYRYAAAAAPLAVAAGHRPRRPRGGGGDDNDGDDRRRPPDGSRYTADMGFDSDDDSDDEPPRVRLRTSPRSDSATADGGGDKRPRTGPLGARIDDVAKINGILDLMTTHLDKTSMGNLMNTARLYRGAVHRAAVDVTVSSSDRRPALLSNSDIKHIEFNPVQDNVAVQLFESDEVLILDRTTGNRVHTLDTGAPRTSQLAFNDAGTLLVVVAYGDLHVWDVESGQHQYTVRYDEDVQPGGHPSNRVMVPTLQARGNIVFICRTQPYTTSSLTGGTGQKMHLVDLAHRTTRSLPINVKCACLGPGTDLLVCTEYLRKITQLDVTKPIDDAAVDRGLLTETDPDRIWSLIAASSDGRRVAAVEVRPFTVHLFDLAQTPAVHHTIDFTDDATQSIAKYYTSGDFNMDALAISPDGELVVVVVSPDVYMPDPADRTDAQMVLLLYDFQTGELQLRLSTKMDGYGAATVTVLQGEENGYRVMCGLSDGWTQWDVSPLYRQRMAARRERLLA